MSTVNGETKKGFYFYAKPAPESYKNLKGWDPQTREGWEGVGAAQKSGWVGGGGCVKETNEENITCFVNQWWKKFKYKLK